MYNIIIWVLILMHCELQYISASFLFHLTVLGLVRDMYIDTYSMHLLFIHDSSFISIRDSDFLILHVRERPLMTSDFRVARYLGPK